MNIKSIGVDIVKNSRLKPKHLNYTLNKKELIEYTHITSTKAKQEYLASRWAAKEAIIKAYNLKVSFKDIEIISNEDKAPTVYLKGKKSDKTLLSISHEKDYSIAFCVVAK